MYISFPSKNTQQIFSCLSERIRSLLENVDTSLAEEIRLRRGKPLVLDFGRIQRFVTPDGFLCSEPNRAYITTDTDIDRSLMLACRGSVYACQEQIRHGYLTLAGGHRIGLAGSAVLDGNDVKSVKDISGMNFRFARQIFGAADEIMDMLVQNGEIKSTLIISPPGCGKTTLLRDAVRRLSERGFKVSLIDERGELAAVSNGVCGYDVGVMTDVLDSCPKAEGMMMAVRSMSPHAVATDEIGSEEDTAAVALARRSGVSVLASIHAKSARHLFESEEGQAVCSLFDVFVTLSKRCGSGTVESVYDYKELSDCASCGRVKKI